MGIDAGGQWVQFQLSTSQIAWIYGPFTTLDRSDNRLPVIRDIPTPPVTVTPAPPQAVEKVKITYQDGPVNVRSGPGTKYEMLGKVNPGDVLNATGTIESGEWIQIQFSAAPDGIGWISSEFTDYDRSLNNLPAIHDLPPTPTP
jgi:hypothetical protein